MALGANPVVTNALRQARLTGRPQTINANGVTLTAQPNGSIGTPGGGGFSAASVDDYGRNIPTVNVYAQPQQTQVQAPLNQANPQTTYVSPNTTQPATAAPVAGQTGTQSGQPVHATYDQPPAPTVAAQAKNYRAQHGLSTSDDAATDALNAQSLAAAQSGRNYFNPAAAAQYGAAQPAGSYGPASNVVNALTLPPTQTAVPAATTAQSPSQVASNNLLQQGIY